MTELSKKIGEMDYDGLITSLNPAVQVSGGVIAKLSEAAIYQRGTILAKSTDGTLSILGSDTTMTPDCILCDDTEVGTDADISTVVYTAGCFDLSKCTAADGYTITEADKDKLRERGIVFKVASAY